MATDQERAEKLVKASANIPNFGYSGDTALGETWAFIGIDKNRDSGLLEQSNFDVIAADLDKRFLDDVVVEHTNHWAVGWVDHLNVRMLDDRGQVTPAGKAAIKWLDKLEDYPIADEDDHSRREYEATWEGVKQAVSDVLRRGDYPNVDEEKVADHVYEWLRDNDEGELESKDDQGGYPSEGAVKEALAALGIEEAEEA